MPDFLVSTTLRLNDELVRGLRRVIETLDRTQLRVDRLQRSFDRLGFATAPKIETAGITRAQQMMDRLDIAARKFSTEVLRPRVDLRAAEAGIARLKGDLVTLAAPVMPAGIGVPGARTGAPDLTRADRSVFAMRLRAAADAKAAEAALAAQREKDIRAAAALQRSEADQNLRHAQRLVNEQLHARIAAERTFLREQAALEKQQAASARTAAGAAAGGEGGGRGYIRSLFLGHREPVEGLRRENVLRYGGGGILGMVAGGAYEQGKALNYVNAALLATHKPMLGPDFRMTPEAKTLNTAIQAISMQTGVPIATSGAEVRMAMRMLQTIPFKQRAALLPELGRFGFIEHFVTGADPVEAIKALIGLAHQWNAFTASKMKGLMAQIAGVSIATGATLPQIEKSAGYVAGTAQALGIPRNEILDLIATANLAGVQSTRGGTWLNALLLTGLNAKGGLAALLSSKAGRRRYIAMAQLGLVQNGQMVGMDKLRQGDILGFAKDLREHLAQVPKDELAGLAYQAFGSIRGTREALLLDLSQFALGYRAVEQTRKNVLGGGTKAVMAQLSEATPSLKFHQTMMSLDVVLMRIGVKVLPPLTDVLRSLDATLKAIIPSLPGGGKGGIPTPHQVAGTGLVVGGAIGTLLGGPLGGAIGAGLGAAAGYGTGAQLNATAAQLKSGYVVLPSPGPVVVAPLSSAATTHAAMAHGGWGGLGGWLGHLFSGSSSHGTSKTQGWGDWLWSFVVPSAHASTMPGVRVAPAARAAAHPNAVNTAAQSLAHAFGLALPMVDFGPAGLAIARAVAQAMGQMAASAPSRSLLVPASYETTGGGSFGGMSFPGGRFSAVSGGKSSATLGQYFAYIKSLGYSNAQAAAITANIWQESSGRAGIVGDHGTSLGLFQEHDERGVAMARAVPDWRTNWQGQIRYAIGEMRQLDPAWFSLTGAPVAAAEWERMFERPKSLADVGMRAAHAGLLLRQFSRSLPGPPVAGIHDGRANASDGHHDHAAASLTDAVKQLHETLRNFGLGAMHGDVLLDGEAVGHVVAHHLERGLARAASGGVARAGARPDFSGGPVLNPPA